MLRNVLFKNWHFMRYFRLALALLTAYQAFETREWFFLVFTAFFLFQAFFNLGCGPQGCAVPKNNVRK